MKVILLSDIKKLGKKGDIVTVADGYAKNLLIPKKMVVPVTKGSLEVLDEQNLQAKLKRQEDKHDAEDLSEKIEKVTLEFKLKVGSQGKIFGSISTKQIMEELQKKYQITVDKRKFIDTSALSSLGDHKVRVDLFKNEVIGTIHVHISGQ